MTAVIHYYWEALDKIYVAFQEMDYTTFMFDECNRPAKPVIVSLKVVHCSYIPPKDLTIHLSQRDRTSPGHNPSYILWNDKLLRRKIVNGGWAYGGMLYNLLRVYSAVSPIVDVCSTSVYPPTGHDSADAFSILRMIQSWKTIKEAT